MVCCGTITDTSVNKNNYHSLIMNRWTNNNNKKRNFPMQLIVMSRSSCSGLENVNSFIFSNCFIPLRVQGWSSELSVGGGNSSWCGCQAIKGLSVWSPIFLLTNVWAIGGNLWSQKIPVWAKKRCVEFQQIRGPCNVMKNSKYSLPYYLVHYEVK